MNNKNISFNHTLEEYNKKYRNRNHRLLKFTKKEVEDFDKKNPTGIKNYLLRDRKWWLIKDTYYEIPIAPRATWFRNLSAGAQVATCVLGAGVLATAVVVPTVLLLNKDGTVNREVSVDEAIEHVKCESKMVDGNLEITLKPDTGYKVTGIKEIKINTYKLQDNEYKYENSKVTIAKEVLSAHTGKVIVTPNYEKDAPAFDSIEVVSLPTKWIYVVGEEFRSAGLKVVGVKGSAKTDITNQCTLSIVEGYIFKDGDVKDKKEITVSYNEIKTSFNIAVNDDFAKYFELDTIGSFYGVKPKSGGAALPTNLRFPQTFGGQDITVINEDAFINCNVEVLDFTNSKINFICHGSFKNCSNLKKIIINDTIQDIGSCISSSGSSFAGCSSLEEIYFSTGDNFSFSGKNFTNCSLLKTITIENQKFANVVEDAGDLDKTLYSNLKNIYLKKGIVLSEESYIYNNFKKSASSDREDYDKYIVREYLYVDHSDNACKIKAGLGFKGGEEFTLPDKDPETGDTVVGIAGSGFYEKNGIGHMILPSTIKSIGGGAFHTCDIKKLTLNNGLESIGTSAFAAPYLEEINIPETLDVNGLEGSEPWVSATNLATVVLDSQSFVDVLPSKKGSSLFSSASTIYIKEGLTEPGSSSLIVTEKFEKAEDSDKNGYTKWINKQFDYYKVSEEEKTCSISANNEKFNKTYLNIPCKINGYTVVETGIESFRGKSVTKVSLPTYFTKIGSNSFKDCKSLSRVDVNFNLKEINAGAFEGSTISEITLNDGLTDIGASAFSGCTNLSEINIPSSVTTIDMCAFQGCNSLNNVKIDSKYAACLKNSSTGLFNSGRYISVLTSIITEHKTEFEEGYLYKNSQCQGEDEGYTIYKMN